MKIIHEVNIDLTPEIMAKAFWNMDTVQQTAFFAALANETKDCAYGYGEMQWCWLQEEIRKNPEANKQYMALSLWAYDFMPESFRG